MKKSLKLLIQVFALVYFIGYIFKTLNWDGAEILLSTGALVLIILTFFWFLRDKAELKRTAIFLFSIFFIAGFTFRIMSLNGAYILGLILPALSLFLIVVLTTEEL